MYYGHHFIKVCGDTWVFDITEFLGYKVVLNKDKQTVKGFKLAFPATSYNKQIVFEKHIGVPAKIPMFVLVSLFNMLPLEVSFPGFLRVLATLILFGFGVWFLPQISQQYRQY